MTITDTFNSILYRTNTSILQLDTQTLCDLTDLFKRLKVSKLDWDEMTATYLNDRVEVTIKEDSTGLSETYYIYP